MRVIIDANVFVSAAIQRGASHRIIESWLSGSADFEVVMCPELLGEVREVITTRPRLRKWISLANATSHLERFEQAAANIEARPGKRTKLERLELDAVRAQADDLRAELADFDQPRGGTVSTFDAASLEELSTVLVKARIARGWTQTFGQIATVGAGVTTFTDSFRASGVDRYRVRAFNAAGYSGYSDVAETMVVGTGEVFPVVAAAPLSGSAPLTVAFDGSGSTSLSGSITGYSWSFGDDQAATGAIVSHTYAAPGVYAASLKVTGGPFGSADVTAVIITVTAPPLVAPNDLTATSPARNRALLTWTNPASSATSWTVERCKGSTCTRFTKIAVLPTTATSYLDTAVKGGTTYTYRLTATGATGSVVSNRATVTVRR